MTVKADLGPVTSTIARCVLIKKETLTPFTPAVFPATVTKSNHSNHEGSSNSPGRRRTLALEKTLPCRHQSTSVSQLPGTRLGQTRTGAQKPIQMFEPLTWTSGSFHLFTWEQSRGKTSQNSSEAPETRSVGAKSLPIDNTAE